MVASSDRVKKFCVSCFAILNISTVLYMNQPESLRAWVSSRAVSRLHVSVAYKLELLDWCARSYAHRVGLDNVWQMFNDVPRFNWWYVIKARYGNGQSLVLPLFGQSRRSFMENAFYDFKEAKFDLNIYMDSVGMETYARYLCRQYPTHDDSPIESIHWELHHQMILEPEDVRKQGAYLDPHRYERVVGDFQCPLFRDPR